MTSRLEFFRQPPWMKQWPFAHTLEMTHLLRDGVLQVLTTIISMSAEPMPVSLVYVQRRNLSRRVQVFMSWVAEVMKPLCDRVA